MESIPLLTAGNDLRILVKTGGSTISLPPGGERQYRLVLSRLADLTVAGNYTVQVRRVLPDGTAVIAPPVHVLLEGAYNGVNWDWEKHDLSVL